jgi:beta-lactamase superfamily II metal-dependent hydrolase
MPNTADGKLYLACINIGHGDCTLIKCPNGKVVLIDCGCTRTTIDPLDTRRDDVANIIKSYADGKVIDVLILTHNDQDHFNQLGQILGRRIKNLYIDVVYHSNALGKYKNEDFYQWNEGKKTPYNQPGRAANIGANGFVELTVDATTGTKPTEILTGTKAGGKSCKIYIYASNVAGTTSQTDAWDRNTRSIVTVVVFGSDKLMVCGDATTDTEAFLVAQYGNGLRVDTLRVGHHGSDGSSSQAFVDKVKPNAAIISCAITPPSRYDLPKKDIIDRYKAYVETTASHQIGYFDGGTYATANITKLIRLTEMNGTWKADYSGS